MKLKRKFEQRNRKRLLACLFTVALIVVLVCSIIFPSGVMNTNAAGSGVPTVSIEEVTSSRTSTTRTVKISLTNGESGVAYTVYYRTQNGSAIAGKHFSAKSGSVRLTSSSASSTVTINLSTSSDAIDGYKISDYTYASNSKNYSISSTKTFICEIYYAESDKGTTYSSTSVNAGNVANTDGTVTIGTRTVTLSCQAPSTTIATTIKSDKAYYYDLTQWNSAGRFQWTSSDNSDYESFKDLPSSSGEFTIDNMNSTSSGWSSSSNPVFGYCPLPKAYSSYFVDILGAKKYIYINKDVSGSTVSSGNVKIRLYNMSSYSKTDNKTTVNVSSIFATGDQGYSAFYNGGNVFGNGISSYTTVNGKGAAEVSSSANYVLFTWCKVYGTGVVNKMRVNYADLYYTYYDNAGPNVTGYYVQDGTYGVGQTIRLSVAFDELVRLRRYTSTPTIKFSVSSTSSSNQTLEFKYAGGDGTNVLYFEATVPAASGTKTITISKLQDFGSMTISNFTNIVDFTYNSTADDDVVRSNWNSGNGDQKLFDSNLAKDSVKDNSVTALTVNTASTKITLDTDSSKILDASLTESAYKTNSSYVYGLSLTYSLTNVTDGDLLYYCWIEGTNATAPASKASYSSVTISGSKATIVTADTTGILGGITTGDYTLCLMYVSSSFAQYTATENYSFDISPPEVTLTASSGYNIYKSKQSFTVTATDNNNITSLEYAVSTSPTMDESSLVFESVDVSSKNINQTLTINKDTAGVDGTTADYYYVYVRLTDANGVSVFTVSDFSLAIDLRSADDIADGFAVSLYSTAGSSIKNDPFYDSSTGSSMLTNELGNAFYKSAGFTWYGVNVSWTYTIKHYGSSTNTDSGTVDGTNDKSYTADWYAITSYNSPSGRYYVISFKSDGWYTLTLTYTGTASDGSQTQFNYTQEVYIYGNGDSTGENYGSLSGENRYLISKYWQLLKGSYKKYNSTTSPASVDTITFNSSGSTPVFATYEEAYSYVYDIEVLDIEEVTVDQDLLNKYNSNSIYVYDNVTMEIGQKWYRYKPSEWTTLTANSYGYYYYDIKNYPNGNLANAVKNNVDLLVGTSSTNSYKYASYGNTLNTDSGNLFLNSTRTGSRSTMYSSSIEYNGQEMILASSYTVTATNGTLLYYRRYGSTDSLSRIASGVKLSDVLTQGAYEFYEIGRYGAVKYYVYVDALSPYLSLTLTSGADADSNIVDLSGSTSYTLYGKSFTITSAEDADEWTVVEVYKGGNVILQMTLKEFYEYSFTDSGTYEIYVFDRSGNQTYLKITLKSTDIEVSYSSASSSSYRFEITSRSDSEITSLTVEFNGDVQSVDGTGNVNLNSVPYATSFTFYYSGTYSITITDRYGYTYSEDITLQKELPDLTVYVYVDGVGYVDITEYPDYYTLSEDGTTYTILSPAALYISWSSSNDYSLTWDVEPDSDDYSYSTTRNTVRYSINASTSGWMATIGYPKDPYASIKIISLTDTTPPIVTVTDDDGAIIAEDEKVNTNYVTITWEEIESAMSTVRYSFNGTSYSLVAADGTATIGSATSPLEEGTYTITATNVLGLITTYTFTVDRSIDVYVTTSDGTTLYDKDATVYENENVQILFTENFTIAISSELYTSGYDVYVAYSEEGVTFQLFRADTEDEANDTEYLFSMAELTALENGAIYYDTNGYAATFMQSFGVYIGKTSDGQLYLAISPVNTTGTETYNESVYSVYVEESGTSLTLNLIICTDSSAIVVNFAEDDVEVEFDKSNSYLTNTDTYIAESMQDSDNLAYIVSITYTFDGGEETAIYAADEKGQMVFTDTTFSEEGTYVISVTNKYGTVTEYTIRVYSSIIINSYVVYDDGTELESGSTTIYSNGSVRIEGVSRTEYTTDVDSLVFQLNEDGSMYVLTISVAGTYNFTVTDNYGNQRAYTVVIAAASDVVLDDKDYAISGLNNDALRADELYTNSQFTINSSYVSDNGIYYITYEYYADIYGGSVLPVADESGVLLNKITGTITTLQQIDLSLGDGLYVIRMYDYYGNIVSYNSLQYVAISYKATEQLTLSRLTQDSTEAEGRDISYVEENGFYSNDTLIFTITANRYVFTVNGETVDLTDGAYTIVADVEKSYEEFTIYYCDDFGNKTSFTAYIYTVNPQIEYDVDDDIKITVDSVTYIKGSASFSCDGIAVTAYYYLGSSTTPVEYVIGEEISGDGEYLLYFVDIAGNVSTVSFVIDTKVSWMLGAGSSSKYDVIFSGAVTSRNVRLMRSAKEELTLVSVTLNGKDITSQFEDNVGTSFVFTDDGEYVVVVADVIGNSETVTFIIASDPVQSLTYAIPSTYVLTTIYYIEEGLNVYVSTTAGTDYVLEDGSVYLYGDHTWEVVLTEIATAETYTFSVETDSTTPEATFSGYADVTKDSVTLKAVSEDSTVKVYKDGSLISTTEVESGKTVTIECSDYGSYIVVVTDLAGNETEYIFTIQYSMDAFTIAFIVIVALLVVALVFVIVWIRRTARIR